MLKQPSLFPGLTRSGRTSSQGQVIVDGWSSEIGSGKWKVTIESERKSILARTGNWQDDENQSWKIRTNILSRQVMCDGWSSESESESEMGTTTSYVRQNTTFIHIFFFRNWLDRTERTDWMGEKGECWKLCCVSTNQQKTLKVLGLVDFNMAKVCWVSFGKSKC